MNAHTSPIIVALDYENADLALGIAGELDPTKCIMKVGKSLFTREGQRVLEKLSALNHKVFLDLKFHDIPNTVYGAVQAAADQQVWMVNVHASGGRKMLEAASQALSHYSHKPLLIGVTILTSMDEQTLHELGCSRALEQQVAYLTNITMASGLDGVVCSAQESAKVKAHYPNAITVTPGIRPLWASHDDQKRVVTPAQAIANGSDYLVIGRPITASKEPQHALELILAEIEQGSSDDARL